MADIDVLLDPERAFLGQAVDDVRDSLRERLMRHLGVTLTERPDGRAHVAERLGGLVLDPRERGVRIRELRSSCGQQDVHDQVGREIVEFSRHPVPFPGDCLGGFRPGAGPSKSGTLRRVAHSLALRTHPATEHEAGDEEEPLSEHGERRLGDRQCDARGGGEQQLHGGRDDPCRGRHSGGDDWASERGERVEAEPQRQRNAAQTPVTDAHRPRQVQDEDGREHRNRVSLMPPQQPG